MKYNIIDDKKKPNPNKKINNSIMKKGKDSSETKSISKNIETIKCESKAKGDHLIKYNIKRPANADVFLDVPYSPNGFQNSCSETSAEMILRAFGVVGWSQYEIHEKGYHTFEGGVSEGDLGLLNMFKYETFCNKKGESIKFHVELFENGDLKTLKSWIDKGIPIIVRIETNDRGDRHTIVIVGYNNEGIFKHDNDLGSALFVPNNRFIKRWLGWYLLVYPIDYFKKER